MLFSRSKIECVCVCVMYGKVKNFKFIISVYIPFRGIILALPCAVNFSKVNFIIKDKYFSVK